MNIEICNLADIRCANIELRPLTVLIGPNNAGKTWLAYILSGIFSSRGWEEYSQAYLRDELPKCYPTLDAQIEKVTAQGNATIDIFKLAEESGERYFQEMANYAKNWMKDYMSTQLINFSDIKILINFAENKEAFLEQVEKQSLLFRMAGGLFTIRKEPGDKMLYAFTSLEDEEQLAEKLSIEEIKFRFVQSAFRILHRSLFLNVRVFPTERTTLVTLPIGSRTSRKQPRQLDQKALVAIESFEKALRDIEELTGLTTSVAIDRNARAAIGPVNNFMSMMSAIFRTDSKKVEKRKAEGKDNPKIQQYIHLAEVLEKQILFGGLDFSTPEPDPRRDILFQVTQNIKLEIPIASSMVKELAPLVFYLRYLAQPGELLIIDEPEMNLHPAAQMQVTEFLGMLANAGLHVLITTHSTYVIDHLTNLIDAYKHKNQSEIVEMFLLERGEAFISQGKVSAYFIGDGKVEDILDAEGGIDWRTFSDVTDLVQRIHFELLEK